MKGVVRGSARTKEWRDWTPWRSRGNENSKPEINLSVDSEVNEHDMEEIEGNTESEEEGEV
jgi:hypothetical protein